jgi:large subunit ribosomal protein L6
MPAILKEEVLVPPGVEFRLEGNVIEITGPKGKLRKEFGFQGVGLKSEGGKIIVEAGDQKRKTKAAVGTIRSHLQNMFKGVTEGFNYKLRVVYSHFPITVKVERGKVLIQNFLGERHPRSARIVGGAEVEVNGDEIIVRGMDKEEVGQTAINIERATVIRGYDKRVFQDGCYIVERG